MLLKKKIDRIPLRICVAGTRGKSSVVRLIAAGLRESRMPLLAKTTGSKPCLLFPDGSEREIRRRGHPTILEGKKILKIASRTGAHAVVLEMMSIRPESLVVESIQMMKPHILVITNIRVDHVEEIGKTKDEIARTLAAAIPGGNAVIIPEEECYPVFRQKVEKAKAKLLLVPPKLSGEEDMPQTDIPAWEFEQNIRIALAVTDFLAIDRVKAWRALKKPFPDFGGLRIWSAEKISSFSGWYFVSAFAANDPETTEDAMTKLENRGLFKGRKRIGLLNLRKDRGGRTMQWFDALREESRFVFDRLVLVGEHAPALRSKLKGRMKHEVTAALVKTPEDLMAHLASLEKEKAVVFGMGNMGGMGRRLVEYWERTGNRYDV